MNNPREFKFQVIDARDDWGLNVIWDFDMPSIGKYHVIEKSAYDELKQENERLKFEHNYPPYKQAKLKLDELKEKLADAEKALEFIANDASETADSFGKVAPGNPFVGWIIDIELRARACLDRIKGK